MSPKLPRISAKELITILKKNGFVFTRAKGSHQTFYSEFKGVHITVPVHPGKIIGSGLLNTILKQAQISKYFVK